MKLIATTVIILVIFTTIVLAITQWGCSTPSFDDLSQELQYLVSNLVEEDKLVRSCVLAVAKGKGSFSWSGAAGIACQDGRVLMSKDTPIHIASVTKLYTATAVMQLYENGVLSLDDPMSKYLPQELIQGIHVYKGKDYSFEISIRQLLSHTSGIADYYTEKPKGGKSLSELFLEEPERSWTVEKTIERAREELEPNFRPDTNASYSDTNFQLLGMIIETVAGSPLHVVFEDSFFRPLGLKNTWLICRSEPQNAPLAAAADIYHKNMIITRTRSNGAYWADGGIVSTAEEMIIFLKALNEGRIISPETLRLMHDWHKLHFPLQYGYGTMYFKLPQFISKAMHIPPLWGHSGSTGSFLYYSEELDLYIAGSINQTESQSKPFRLMADVVKAIESNRRTVQNNQ